MIGRKVGGYEILDRVGRGGMGDVYRARDTRLDRDVAIKTLPPELAKDAARLARFEREAKLLASLDHPNIATVFGFEESDGEHFLALELVRGESLAERLSRGALPLDELLPMALQIAEGLEAAHENGVVHRDLKPANIMVEDGGRVKLLDFGLAKGSEESASRSSDLSASPTLTAQMTQAGMILGTAAYMSPEQARGKAVDKRTDIWAFGCVLYEMLTGRPAFDGEDVPQILSAVLRLEPDLERLPPGTPPPLRRLVSWTLRKDPRARLRDIGDARLELEQLLREPEGEPGASLPPAKPSRLPWVLLAGMAVALAAALLRPGGEAPEPPVRRFTVEVPAASAPNWTDFVAALSPNGARIAYNCRDGNRVEVCLRELDSLTAEPIVEARDVDLIFFSPDGEWLAIWSSDRLAKVPVAGGMPETIFENPAEGLPRFASIDGFYWGTDGWILFGAEGRIFRVVDSGGTPEPMELGDSEDRLAFPAPLPVANRILVTRWSEQGLAHGAVADLSGGRLRELPLLGSEFRYVPPGFLVYRQLAKQFAVAFDPESGSIQGEPKLVLEDVRRSPQVAEDGTMLYIPVRGESEARVVWVDREGRVTPIAGERRNYSHLDLSPNGELALLNIGPEIYLRDLERGTRQRVVAGSFPVWTSDGERATFVEEGVEWIPADGSGEAETLIATDEWLVPTSWNAATGDLAYYSHRTFEIWIRPPEGEPYAFLRGGGRLRSGRFSPDGRWLAYVDDETGEYQVYVTAYPGPGPRIPVSLHGGLSPIWSSDGTELFFRRGGQVLAAGVSYEGGIRFGSPEVLFEGPFTLDLMGHQRYDVTPDGRSFLMVENSDDFPIALVQNWSRELERLVSAEP